MEKRSRPPPLPPRAPTAPRGQPAQPEPAFDDAPPPYEAVVDKSSSFFPHDSNDPRNLSTDSLVPDEAREEHHGLRRLLLVYIHGFMGNETSFQHFPAHVHNYVSALVAETHVVHTKIYPRYRSKKHINFARDDFGKWLAPHQSETTDVVLMGHSMGGLLSAEVVLVPDRNGETLAHRIMGTINFDVPFLGMHPGVIKSGLASIFQPALSPDHPPTDMVTPGQSSTSPARPNMGNSTVSLDSMLSTRTSDLPSDPNYNPHFDNDANLPVRSGWRGIWHFVSKHSDDIIAGTTQLVKSHMEFGGAMADYPTLKKRYARIRALEEDNQRVRSSVIEITQTAPRVRFVNFYTASTGRPKKLKDVEADAAKANATETASPYQTMTMTNVESGPSSAERTTHRNVQSDKSYDEDFEKSPDLSINPLGSHDDETTSDLSEEDTDSFTFDMDHVDPMPISSASEGSDSDTIADDVRDLDLDTPATTNPDAPPTMKPSQMLPPLQPPPPKPVEPGYSAYTDPSMRKVAEKEHARAIKAYEKAVRNRDKAQRDREKLDEKWLSKQQKAVEKASKKGKSKESLPTARVDSMDDVQDPTVKASKQQSKDGLEPEALGITRTTSTNVSSSSAHPDPPESELPRTEKPKKQKDRTFCSLPPRDAQGVLDPTWVRVYMQDMDEVSAHCGLFFAWRPAYEAFVAEVAERVQMWIGEAESERLARWIEVRDVD